ncbi:MAG: mannose-1-phosphate guanylyltransferase/mannose-6-phosphate isomerase [Nevskiaceae bacterium]|nr:MAG: mannose-1-phosphate guanylyltransferase/mannose-6-phosphate isomerase [Nevskiaceae bacterium]TAM29024.1 MAG: mannose-1-phosphate guanylyltransferase/mannose-6-phosphate isomerase [Nevskiaceae bacterium]
MAGGTGTRLWPLSREQYPKQFIALTDERSLLQVTALRASRIVDATPPLAICGEDQRFLVGEQMRGCGMQSEVLIEPAGRNTAPAAACAALRAQARFGEQTLVLLMAADHVISDEEAFVQAVELASGVARQGKIAVFGIRPTRPETGYGYIRVGAERNDGAYELAAFVEKPDRERAEAFLSEGGYYWNGGLFLFRADVMLAELQRFEPELLAQARLSLEKARSDLDFVRLDPESFKACRNESIDYAVMEKTDKAAVVLLDAGWDDVGSWTFLDQQPKDDCGNAVRGDTWLHDAHNNLVHAESRLVALAGVSDTIVVETKDAVLVTTRERAQDVKKIVARLKAEGRSEAVHHPTVYRPWGSYETIAMDERFQVKRIIVKPGQKLSLQMHHHRAEHWIVVKGTAEITVGEKVFMLTENQSTYIPLGEKHRLVNPGRVPLELIEVQSGSYLGEDDIVRFEDIYGRSPK